jgi:CHAT domain-containing protein/tetratricopeptide (TPR) repeat protein
VDQKERHLSDEEIGLLIGTLPGAGETQAGVAFLDEARRHLGACEACQRLVSMHQECDRILRHLRYEAQAEPGNNCPPERSLYELAAGLMSDDKAAAILSHVTGCAHCCVVLRRVSEELATETSPAEQAVISSLETASEEWQKKFATKLAASSTTAEVRRSAETNKAFWPRFERAFFWRFAYAAAAALLLLCGFWTYRKFREPPIDHLLAEAYSERRTMELRITGAGHAPLRHERGEQVSSLTKPAALLKAEYEIRDQLSRRSEDASLLAAKGKAELLEGQYSAALASLNHALDLGPDAPDLLCDLATAYAQRGEAENRPLDYGEALEYLGRALAKRPNDPVFLFNRAVVDERLNLFEQAQNDWDHYLKVDPNGPWADEARQRLDAIRQKLKESLAIPPADHNAERAIPLLKARAQGEIDDPSLWTESRDEDYLDIAVREWLFNVAQQARPSDVPGMPEWHALTVVSTILASKHGDPWLQDLLSNRPSPTLLEGWADLSLAASRNAEGDFDGARDSAMKAVRILLEEKSAPGVLRALWEEMYALQRSQQGHQCLNKVAEARSTPILRRYRWLSSQVQLDESVCLAMVGQLSVAREGVQQGLQIAESANYGTLSLRGMHLAGVEIAANNPERAWDWFDRGLRRHWSGAYRPFRAYQFYAEMSFTPENRGQWYLARQLMEEAVAHIGRTPNRMTEAMARHSLAVDTQLSGDLEAASEEFREAEHLFASLPSTPATRSLLFSAEVYQAALEAQQGRSELALATLAAARRNYTEQAQYRMWQHYYEALGTALAKGGKNDEDAERALRAAVFISEGALGTLRTDEDRLLWERNSARSYRSLVELEAKRNEDPTAALEIWEWYSAAGIRGSSAKTRASSMHFEELDAGPALPRLSLVANTLPTLRSASVISFAQLGGRFVVWIFDDRGVHRAQIRAPSLEIGKTVRKFLRLCGDPHSDAAQIRSVGRQLYDWLIAPIERYLITGRLLAFETDGEIGQIPFNVLVAPTGEYLGQRFQILTSPGLGFWLRLRPSRPISPLDRALVVGASGAQGTAWPGLPLLPDADEEAREISKLFPRSTILLDQSATAENVKREVTSVRVFHFAGHAVATTGRSGLVFGTAAPGARDAADRPFVDAEVIGNFAMPQLQLVVLSACATGADDGGLTDPESLVRVFLRSGATQVVASRWSVDSASTEELMKLFYEELAAGAEPPLALRNAEESVRKQPLTAHPYYWASFGVFGRN